MLTANASGKVPEEMSELSHVGHAHGHVQRMNDITGYHYDDVGRRPRGGLRRGGLVHFGLAATELASVEGLNGAADLL